MNRMTKGCCVSLMLICGFFGCEDAKPTPPTVPVAKSIETGPVAKKSMSELLPTSCPPEILELMKSDTPKARVEAGKRLGILLRESWQTRPGQSSESRQNQSQLQADVLDKIAQLGPSATDAIPALEEILKQMASVELKQKVLDLLLKLGAADKRLGPTLAFASRDPKLQKTSIQLLIHLGCDDPASVTALGEALRNPELLEVSLLAMNDLEDQGVARAARFVMEVASSNKQPLETRLAAIQILGKFTRAGVPSISQLWNDDDPAIRKASMRLGINDGDLLVREKDPEVIAAAFEGFARPPIKPKYLASVFEQALKKESLREPIEHFLKEHPDLVAGTLLQLFKSNSAMIRDYSIDRFADLENNEHVVADLMATLNESNDTVLRTLAVIKLGEVPSNVDLKELAEGASKWISQPKLKDQVLVLLTKLGPEAADALTHLATDARLDSTLKVEIQRILLNQPDIADVAEPLLQVAIESEDASTRHWAAVLLTKLANDNTDEFVSEVSPILQDALKSPGVPLIKATLEALRENPKLGTELSGEIIERLKHESPIVRTETVLTLAKIAPVAKQPSILEALKKVAAEDSDAGVKEKASESLKELEKADPGKESKD